MFTDTQDYYFKQLVVATRQLAEKVRFVRIGKDGNTFLSISEIKQVTFSDEHAIILTKDGGRFIEVFKSINDENYLRNCLHPDSITDILMDEL